MSKPRSLEEVAGACAVRIGLRCVDERTLRLKQYAVKETILAALREAAEGGDALEAENAKLRGLVERAREWVDLNEGPCCTCQVREDDPDNNYHSPGCDREGFEDERQDWLTEAKEALGDE